MKSIVQEASSIAKAIEQGLVKAGNPRDFAVKILEYPEKNFFGMTTKPAKIALYCDDRTRKPHEPYTTTPSIERPEKSDRSDRGERSTRDRQPNRENTRDSRRDNREHRDARDNRFVNSSETLRTEEVSTTNRERPHQPRTHGSSYQHQSSEASLTESRREEEPIIPRWSAETVRHSKEWLTRVLDDMNRPVPFTIEIDNLCLRITLDQRLFDDPEHERKVLASLSLLLIETSKHAYKLNLRGHKVLLTHRS